MPVTDDQTSTLRALLAGDFEEHKRLRERLDRDGARAGYLALLEAACFEAIDRRFAQQGSATADVIEFVGSARARSDEIEDQLDPHAAERLIRAVLGDGSIDEMDDKTRFGTEIVLLGVLIADEHLDNAGLNDFLAEARKLANEWID
jgi:hypothetical protein